MLFNYFILFVLYLYEKMVCLHMCVRTTYACIRKCDPCLHYYTYKLYICISVYVGVLTHESVMCPILDVKKSVAKFCLFAIFIFFLQYDVRDPLCDTYDSGRTFMPIFLYKYKLINLISLFQKKS